MKQSYSQNNFLVYFIILFGFFILLFFTKNIFAQTQVLLDEKSSNEQQTQELRGEVDRLKKLQTEVNDDSSEIKTQIQGFTQTPSEDELLTYIYGYADTINKSDERMLIRNLSISP